MSLIDEMKDHLLDVDKSFRACEYRLFEKAITQLEQADKMREAMQEFLDRCDKGEVRSKRTYSKFKSILSGMNYCGIQIIEDADLKEDEMKFVSTEDNQ